MNDINYDNLSREELITSLLERDKQESGGIRITYKGQTPPWQIIRKVQPRAQKIVEELCFGAEDEQAENLIIEGENLQAMVSLYKYRGQVDLILTDPPYNTGNDFRYNDKWDTDPNDPELGDFVPADDGSRHSKWLRFIAPRLWMMKEMLKPNGVCAICIDERELFRLGMLMDNAFGEANRIAIINWQKSYSAKSDSGHVSSATEYILVYAKDKAKASTGLLDRTDAMNAKYRSVDGDPDLWRSDNLSAKAHPKPEDYGIQSPFTGVVHYPPTSRWRMNRSRLRRTLEAWGSEYVEMKDPNATLKSVVLKGTRLQDGQLVTPDHILGSARDKALAIRDNHVWPVVYFGNDGEGRPGLKRYLKDVKKGRVAMTYWADEDYEESVVLDSQSWDHEESGHSQAGIKELSAIMGPKHGFDTVKPLKLFTKVIQLWCPPSGIVMDPFAGSGTTGHASLMLNEETGSERRFVLIESGRRERDDDFAKTLTAERVRRVITGSRPTESGSLAVVDVPLPGGFRFTELTDVVDAEAVLALQREEMIDLLLTSHWDQSERSGSHLQRLVAGSYDCLFATSGRGEGFYLVWKGPDAPSVLDRTSFRRIAHEAKSAELTAPYHVYARICTYSGPNIEFYQIPDRILDKLGFNQSTEPFTNSSAGDT